MATAGRSAHAQQKAKKILVAKTSLKKINYKGAILKWRLFSCLKESILFIVA